MMDLRIPLAVLAIFICSYLYAVHSSIKRYEALRKAITPQAMAICRARHQSFYTVSAGDETSAVECVGRDGVKYSYVFVPTAAARH
jgi:chloramphenicol O-acetyltransferase